MVRVRQDGGICGRLLQIAVFALAGGWAGALCAPEASAATTQLRVMARVAGFFRMRVERQSVELTVTAHDIALGYVEAPAATAFSVTSNTPDGYVIEFRPTSDIFDSAVITGLPDRVEIRAQGGTALYNVAHGRTSSHQLSYRFALRSGLQPGNYGWPLEISVRSS